MAVTFEWSAVKAANNERKHGVSFEEAATVFNDPRCGITDDPLHSQGEERFILIGTSINHRIVVVAYADRGDRIRIISARLATRRERKKYDEENGQ